MKSDPLEDMQKAIAALDAIPASPLTHIAAPVSVLIRMVEVHKYLKVCPEDLALFKRILAEEGDIIIHLGEPPDENQKRENEKLHRMMKSIKGINLGTRLLGREGGGRR